MRTIAALPKEIAGEKVTYIALDDESDPTKGTQNARRLVIQDGVDILIGSSLTPVTMPMLDVAVESKTPIISLAAATAIVQPMDDRRRWAFKVVPNDDLMAAAILKYIAKSGIKTLGYIGVSDGYGEGYYKEVSRLAPGLGLTVTTHEVYARADTSATGQALKVIATNLDAVFYRVCGHAGGAAAGGAARAEAMPARSSRPTASPSRSSSSSAAPMSRARSSPARPSPSPTICRPAIRSARSRDEFVSSYEKVNGQKPNIFGAHLWDAVTAVQGGGGERAEERQARHRRNSAPRCATSWSAARTST